MTFTTEDALRIAEESGFPELSMQGLRKYHADRLTRALNLAAAEALAYGAGSSLVDPVSQGYLIGLANEYRAAAQGDEG